MFQWLSLNTYNVCDVLNLANKCLKYQNYYHKLYMCNEIGVCSRHYFWKKSAHRILVFVFYAIKHKENMSYSSYTIIINRNTIFLVVEKIYCCNNDLCFEVVKEQLVFECNSVKPTFFFCGIHVYFHMILYGSK